MNIGKTAMTAILLTTGVMEIAPAAELQPDTLAAWNAYLQQADSQMQERVQGHLPFLWVDEAPERVARVRRGEAAIAPMAGRGTKSVPHGLIHDWIGAIFIPGATIDDLWAVVHDYNDYQRIYQPVVASSRTLACGDDSQEFQMVWHRKVLFVSAAVQGRYESHDFMLDRYRGYNVAEAVEVREIEQYGHEDQRLLPPDTGSGFIWRIRSTARYEERDGGVYLEVRAMALTRDIPSSVAWMVRGVVNHLSINSLTATLQETRDAATSSRGLEISASCPRQAHGTDLAKAGE